MKRASLYIFLLLFFSAAAFTAAAQDAGMSEVDALGESVMSDDEKTHFVPGEGLRYVPRNLVKVPSKDSISLQMNDFPMQQATMNMPEEPAEKQAAPKKDESILTFNLLYYIIQKYKLQDIID